MPYFLNTLPGYGINVTSNTWLKAINSQLTRHSLCISVEMISAGSEFVHFRPYDRRWQHCQSSPMGVAVIESTQIQYAWDPATTQRLLATTSNYALPQGNRKLV